MKVLVFNCGSSTLKVKLFEVAGNNPMPDKLARIASCTIDRIGQEGFVEFTAETGQSLKEVAALTDHADATRRVLDWLDSIGIVNRESIGAVGHRVVHGGNYFRGSVIIDDNVIDGIKELTQLAPLHNGPSLQAIEAVNTAVGNAVPAVAVFDTAFHSTIPETASRYAIPYDLANKHHLQRYGFHGIAHRYMAERFAAISRTSSEDSKVITLQLGNGCSACAVRGGRSIDTSMGLTPLEGLIMGTRCGDIDPSLPSLLTQLEEVTAGEVEEWLNQRSGLLGVSGSSWDMRELLKAEQEGDDRAALAIDMFCYRVRKYIGAYLTVLEGADAVVFGGGIGENSPQVRQRICAGLEWCGLVLDTESNSAAIGKEADIHANRAKIGSYVVPVDEASVIVRETIRCLSTQQFTEYPNYFPV